MSELNWSEAIHACQKSGDAYVIATVLGCSGSTPREPSSKMVITEQQTYDTIGGGQLEFAVTQKARELLIKGNAAQVIQHFPLAAGLAQCCGGSTTVLLEAMAACPFRVTVFGAGHVAEALMTILQGLPCKVLWVDSRAEQFPPELLANAGSESRGGDKEGNITALVTDDPVDVVSDLAPDTDVLILTHNHQLDFELCQAALNHGSLRYIGMIGSQTKSERFRKRLARNDFTQEQIDRIVSPVGLSEVPGKLPMEVAVSIAGQLIAVEHQNRERPVRRGLGWKELKSTLGDQATPHKGAISLSLKDKS
ncbi:xanthine dehydrogenase accessory protein XdhC [Hahella sp. CCB-MM4]|uniref:xanthine dehydrogenase accessory protein XdhC n=1 Tax=Hahella sp. (strain CCB-MM4) TaxID=1926491 RepID=UPI000B9A62D5|nr:xanthine dehydrogenase accessory protein XdhC [Hahella sp. CCB-MM4]OZG70260.1 xanthine dehydrogenase accessory protein XdhC [Hahella sp. CCB-MM4]